MRLDRNLLVFAAFNGAMAVALGAFAAHGAGPAIKSLLTTGAQYQMVHAVLAVVSRLLIAGPAPWAAKAPSATAMAPLKAAKTSRLRSSLMT